MGSDFLTGRRRDLGGDLLHGLLVVDPLGGVILGEALLLVEVGEPGAGPVDAAAVPVSAFSLDKLVQTLLLR